MNDNERELKPAFDFSGDESSVLLYQGRAEFRAGENIHTGSGEVRLDLGPRSDIHIYGSFDGDLMVDALSPQIVRSFSINEHEIEGFAINPGVAINIPLNKRTSKIEWLAKFRPVVGVGDESTIINRVIFHLFNFDNLHGMEESEEQKGERTYIIRHIFLINEKWKIELKSLFFTRENIEQLEKEGGYKLTHIGEIRKIDQTLFTGKDAEECLEALDFFFSFAKGSWCNPVCAVGFDKDENRVWEAWSSPIDPWKNPLSWFERSKSSQLSVLFPDFIKRWENDNWNEALREVIYWYLNANDFYRGTEAGIILTQSAIERLSYEYSVKEKKLLTLPAFKALPAPDKLRLLFSSLGISLEISSASPILLELASSKQINWEDAPRALTDIRNSLVHPEHKHREQVRTAYVEAWNLGLWYLEMCILAICGYSGTCVHRLKQRALGEVEDVPWKQNHDESC